MTREIVEAPAPISNCPHCGSEEGYYTKDYMSGSFQYRHNYDGTVAENGDMYDTLTTTQSKYAYCLTCRKRLFRMK